MVPRSGVTPIDAVEREVPLLARQRGAPGVGEVDRAVGLDDDVVRPVEAAALEAVGDHGEAAVELLPGDAAAVVLAGEQPALEIAGEPVRPVGLAPGTP